MDIYLIIILVCIVFIMIIVCTACILHWALSRYFEDGSTNSSITVVEILFAASDSTGSFISAAETLV